MIEVSDDQAIAAYMAFRLREGVDPPAQPFILVPRNADYITTGKGPYISAYQLRQLYNVPVRWSLQAGGPGLNITRLHIILYPYETENEYEGMRLLHVNPMLEVLRGRELLDSKKRIAKLIKGKKSEKLKEEFVAKSVVNRLCGIKPNHGEKLNVQFIHDNLILVNTHRPHWQVDLGGIVLEADVQGMIILDVDVYHDIKEQLEAHLTKFGEVTYDANV